MQNDSSPFRTAKMKTELIIFYSNRIMRQEEKWESKWQEVVTFIKTNHRNPSRHRIEEHDMLNWVKHNRKRYKLRIQVKHERGI